MYNKRILILYKISIEYLVQDVIIILSTNNKAPWQLKNKGFTLFSITAIIIVTINNVAIKRGGERMVVEEMNNGEIIQRGIEDFREVQRYMLLARKENATETYSELKEKYISLKALLNSLGVNLSDIDKIKE